MFKFDPAKKEYANRYWLNVKFPKGSLGIVYVTILFEIFYITLVSSYCGEGSCQQVFGLFSGWTDFATFLIPNLNRHMSAIAFMGEARIMLVGHLMSMVLLISICSVLAHFAYAKRLMARFIVIHKHEYKNGIPNNPYRQSNTEMFIFSISVLFMLSLYVFGPRKGVGSFLLQPAVTDLPIYFQTIAAPFGFYCLFCIVILLVARKRTKSS